MNRALHVLWVCLIVALSSLDARAFDAPEPPVLAPGDFKITGAGGSIAEDREWTWTAEASVRAGIFPGVELAGPLALGVTLFESEHGSGVVVGGGVTDMWITEGGHVLWTPSLSLAAQARVGTGASFRAHLDLTSVEEDAAEGEHPAWTRGSAGLIIDMGPYLTIALGFAYQRKSFGGDTPAGTHRPGWVGDARFSIGSVRLNPFEETPVLAVHVGRWLDLVGLARADFDTDRDSSQVRLLAGVRMRLSLAK